MLPVDILAQKAKKDAIYNMVKSEVDADSHMLG